MNFMNLPLSTKRALIVSPYLDHLGGGERYMLEAASALEKAGYQLFFAWENLAQVTHLTEMLGITLEDPQIDQKVLPHYFTPNNLSMFKVTRGYDLVFYMSDGSIPLLGGKKNFLHMQVPFHNIGGRSIKNKLKKLLLSGVVVNSRFTKKIVDQEYGINSKVIYPPVSDIVEQSKEKIILSVGRFEPSLNVKQQDKLIEAFKVLSKDLPEWKLVLVGASSSDEYIDSLKKKAGKHVEIITNAPYSKVQELYGKSSIYWHAAGLNVDQDKNPELTEHFGITTAEAISAGCIPLVVPKGGQTEVVPASDFYWNSIEELVDLTTKVAHDLAAYRGLAAGLSVNQYNVSNFRKQIVETLS